MAWDSQNPRPMDVLSRYLVLLDDAGRRIPGNQQLERVSVPWDEATWDRVIVENHEPLADALRCARVIDTDSVLKYLGRQIDNIDVVFAVVGRETNDFRRLVLLEDKLLRNPEAKRHVLAQILDYARTAHEDWPSSSVKLSDKFACLTVEPETLHWIIKHEDQIKAACRREDFLLVVAGDGIDERMERLARRFAQHDDPLSLSELALVSFPIYRWNGQLLLVPYVVSAVQRSERELTVKVVVQQEDGTPLEAAVERVVDMPESPATRRLVIKPEVAAFLQHVRDRVAGMLSGVKATERPRKSLDFVQQASDGTKVTCRVHFGGYRADVWSPIEVGIGLTALTTDARDKWLDAFKAHLNRLPVGTECRTSGPVTADVFKSIAWEEVADLNGGLLDSIVDDFGRVVSVVRELLPAGVEVELV